MKDKDKIIKLSLEFSYFPDEDISDWNIDIGKNKIETIEDAIEAAYQELENNSIRDFEFKVIK